MSSPPVSTWNVRQVCSWLESSGFSDQVQRFEERGVTGEILLNLDQDTLKDHLSVRSVGRRISLLNAVYQLKALHQIPVDDGDYEPVSKRSSPVRIRFESGFPDPISPNPPSSEERSDELSQLESALHEGDDTVNQLSQEIRRLHSDMGHIREDLTSLWKVAKERNRKAASARSPFRTSNQESNGSQDQREEKTFRISPDDPCHKVLKSALNPYKLDKEWMEYALFIVYGKDKRNEKCLNYDEKPHKLFQRLKVANEAPMLVLKHIKHLPSPVYRTVAGSGTSSAPVSAFPESESNRKRAVAVYEYTAERDDELDVSIGDEFAIHSRPIVGWCVVERKENVGWVPEAVLEDANKDDLESFAPLKGISLFDYDKTGTNELSVKKDDLLLIRKIYRHWLLAEVNGREGWIPSCYVTYERNRVDEGEKDSEVSEGTLGPSNESILITASPIMLRMDSAIIPSMDSPHQPEIPSYDKKGNAKPHSSSSEQNDVSPTFLQQRLVPSTENNRQSMILESEPVSSPALTKLSVLLDNLNPYMDEERKPETRLEKILTELNVSLLTWQSELGALNENGGGKEDPLSESLDLTDLVGTLSGGSPNRPMILDMLEELLRENGDDHDGIGENGRSRIRSKVDRTLKVLTKVVDVLFKDQATTPGNG